MVSTDEMYGFEARVFRKRFTKLLAEQYDKPNYNNEFHECLNGNRSSKSNESMHQGFEDPCKSYVESISLGKRCRR